MSPYRAVTRPRTVTITFWWVFLLGTWNAGRAAVLARQLRLLMELGGSLDPRIRLIYAAAWAALFWWLAWSLRRHKSSARRTIPILLLLYGLLEIAILFLFAQSSTARRAWPLHGLTYLATALTSFWALNRSKSIPYFQAALPPVNKGNQ